MYEFNRESEERRRFNCSFGWKKKEWRKLKCWFTSEFKECRKFNCDRAVKTVRTRRGSGSAIIQLEFAVST